MYQKCYRKNLICPQEGQGGGWGQTMHRGEFDNFHPHPLFNSNTSPDYIAYARVHGPAFFQRRVDWPAQVCFKFDVVHTSIFKLELAVFQFLTWNPDPFSARVNARHSFKEGTSEIVDEFRILMSQFRFLCPLIILWCKRIVKGDECNF